MTASWRLRIGPDVTVRIRDSLPPPASRDRRFEVDDQSPPQLVLDVIRDHHPDLDGAQLLFDSHGLWRVASAGTDHLFELPRARVVVDFDRGEGRVYPRDPAEPFDLTFPLDEVLFARLLVDRAAVIIHACGVDAGGRGLLLAGNSGAGKSTLADLLAREGVRVLNDDRTAVSLRHDGILISGTPWHGTARRASPASASLKSLFFIRHAARNQVQPLLPLEAATRLVALSVLPYWHRPACERALDTALHVVAQVPAFDLGFVPDRTACTHIVDALDGP